MNTEARGRKSLAGYGAQHGKNAMTHIARLLLFSTLLLSPVGSTLVAAADEPLGVLVVAHGSTTAWNATVEASVAIIQQHTPSQVAYLMGAKNRTPQEAYDDLVAACVQRVVIVPLLVSSHSSHYEQIRFIGRLRDDYPGSDWMSLTPLHGPADVVGTQVLAKLVFTASPGNVWRAAAERYDTRVETDRSATAGPRRSNTGWEVWKTACGSRSAPATRPTDSTC